MKLKLRVTVNSKIFYLVPSRRGSECQHHQVDLVKRFSSIPSSLSPSSITITKSNQEKNVERERDNEFVCVCVCLRTNLSDDLRLPRNILSRGSYASRSIYPAPVNLRFGRRTNRKRRSWCGGNRGRRRTLDDRRRWSDGGGGGGRRAIVGDGRRRRRGGPEGTVEPLRDTFLRRHCFWGKMFGVSSCFLLLLSLVLFLSLFLGGEVRSSVYSWLAGPRSLNASFSFSKIPQK